MAFRQLCLNLPRPVTRRLILQQAHGQTLNRPPIACRLTVSCSISLPLSGFFSPFPRGTGSLSVTQEYLALRDGSRGFTWDFTCPMLLGIQLVSCHFRLQDFHLLWCSFQLLRLVKGVLLCCPTTPVVKHNWFRLFPLRSPLLGESLLISLPPATKMFQFAGFALCELWIHSQVLGVAPFGHLRLIACFQLPGAFRRSPRPSSPLCA